MRIPSAASLLGLSLSLTACADRPPALTVVAQPAPPLVSPEEAELFRCPAPLVLAVGVSGYEDLEDVALRLRDAYDACRDLDDRLVDLVTKPATASGGK